MKNSVQRGSVAELVTAAEASKRDYVVSMPLSHNSQYDLILGAGHRLLRCQIKRAFTMTDTRRKNELLCVAMQRFNRGKVKARYANGDFDILVACHVETDDLWFIPFQETVRFKTFLYLGKTMDAFKNVWP